MKPRARGYHRVAALLSLAAAASCQGRRTGEAESVESFVGRFVAARNERAEDMAYTAAQPFLTAEAIASYAELSLCPVSNPHCSRHEVLRKTRLQGGEESVRVRIFDAYTGYGEIGYHDEDLLLREEGASYRIHRVVVGRYVDLGKFAAVTGP